MLRSTEPDHYRHKIAVLSPVSGSPVGEQEVTDPMFRAGLLGPGGAIRATSNRIHAPFPGQLVSMPAYGYELMFKASNGLLLRIQIGADASRLMGERWQRLVAPAMPVARGTALASFDPQWLKRQSIDPLMLVTVDNNRNLTALVPTALLRLRALEDPLLTLYV